MNTKTLPGSSAEGSPLHIASDQTLIKNLGFQVEVAYHQAKCPSGLINSEKNRVLFFSS